MFLRYKQLQHVFECRLLALTQAHNRFATGLLPCDDTLFEVGPEIGCVKSLLLLWKPHSWF